MCNRKYNQEESVIMNNFKYKSKKICHYCGKTITDKNDVTVDHKDPVSRGGETKEYNLVIACKFCNEDKSDLNEHEYTEYKKALETYKYESEAIESTRQLIITYKNAITQYDDIVNNLSKTRTEISSLERTIRDSRFNAANGYKLCADLRDLLIDERRLDRLKRDAQPLMEHAKNNINILEQIFNSTTKKYKQELRETFKGKFENVTYLKNII